MTPRTKPVDLYRTILALIEAEHPFAVATVLKAENSTPVKAGAKAIIERGGTIHGTIGGGAVEAETQRQAKSAIRSGTPIVLNFDLRGPGVHSASPICGGLMRVLVAPGSSVSHADYRRVIAALARRKCGLWVTTLRTRRGLEMKSHFVLEKDLSPNARFPAVAQLRACLEQARTKLFPGRKSSSGGLLEVFVEPVIPQPVLVIVGGGHVGQAVAAQASLLGFEIVVMEDRSEFANGALFPPGTQTHCGSVAEQLAAFPVDKDTFIVLVTRGHQQDSVALRACIRRPAAYIGMIGSRRKVPLVRRQFLESGWATAAKFDRVYAPIGLDIGAVTVPEIAASIVAQMIAVRRKGAAPRMSPK